MHRPGGVPDVGGEAAEQGRRRLPHQHPVAEELLAPGLMIFAGASLEFFFTADRGCATPRLLISDQCIHNPPVLLQVHVCLFVCMCVVISLVN